MKTKEEVLDELFWVIKDYTEGNTSLDDLVYEVYLEGWYDAVAY